MVNISYEIRALGIPCRPRVTDVTANGQEHDRRDCPYCAYAENHPDSHGMGPDLG